MRTNGQRIAIGCIEIATALTGIAMTVEVESPVQTFPWRFA